MIDLSMADLIMAIQLTAIRFRRSLLEAAEALVVVYPSRLGLRG
jgi:hypothetical protein